jgi:cytochrome c biogenesis protein CcmG/thiol:disulfide interchange protein DsbE
MKRTILLLCMALAIASFKPAEEPKKSIVPAANVKTLKGEIVNTSTFQNDGKPILINFWATWCKPCIQELTAWNNVYDDWKKETGVKIITISTDDARTAPKVAPFINGKRWEFENYLDENGDFKRAMNVNVCPYSFLLDKDGKIVWQHNSYAPGDEEKLFEEIKKLVAEPAK